MRLFSSTRGQCLAGITGHRSPLRLDPAARSRKEQMGAITSSRVNPGQAARKAVSSRGVALDDPERHMNAILLDRLARKPAQQEPRGYEPGFRTLDIHRGERRHAGG